jgi:hypothetical protein
MVATIQGLDRKGPPKKAMEKILQAAIQEFARREHAPRRTHDARQQACPPDAASTGKSGSYHQTRTGCKSVQRRRGNPIFFAASVILVTGCFVQGTTVSGALPVDLTTPAGNAFWRQYSVRLILDMLRR